MFLSCCFCLTVQNYKIFLMRANFIYKKCNFIYKLLHFAKWTLQNRVFSTKILSVRKIVVPLRRFLVLICVFF